MAKAFPIGLSTLEKIRSGDYYYVDKTPFVEQLVQQGQYYFLSRPRRFGKSLLLDTIKQAFLGNQTVFKDLYLDHHWDWSKKYAVIHIAFTSNQVSDCSVTLVKKIVDLLQTIATTHGVTLRGELYSSQFSFLIQDIAEKSFQKKVVILVDEYDKPILDAITEPELARENRDILRGFYSVIKEHDDKVHFAFLTGVSKFSKAGVFSGLNQLNDITYDASYATICGYTQHELETTFQSSLTPEDLPEIKRWYNGYYFLGAEGVYNPFSILSYFAKGKQFSNYWFVTGTPTFLVDLIRQRQFYLPQLEKMDVTENSLYTFDLETLPLIPLLLQAGYLTVIKTKKLATATIYTLGYPNIEVRQSLNDCLAETFTSPERKNSVYIAMYEALSTHRFDAMKGIFSSLFSAVPHQWYRNNGIQQYEGYYCAVVYAYFMGLGYQAIAEDVTSQGQIDMTLILEDGIVIMEFKLSTKSDAQSAMNQIKNKQYAEKYRSHQKPIYLLALSFDPDKRNVNDCLLEQAC